MRHLGSVLAGLVLVGSAASTAGAAAAPGRESCRLLRTSEITQALGQPSTGPERGAAPLACDWRLQPTESRPMGALSVYVQRGDEAREAFALAKELHQHSQVRVRSLGRRAFYAPSLGALYVLEDRETLFFVQGAYPTGSTYDADALQHALVGLASRVERRL